MGKRLTLKVVEERTIGKIIERIKTIEEVYGIPLTRFACQRYAEKRRAEAKLEKEIAQRERELSELKSKSGGKNDNKK